MSRRSTKRQALTCAAALLTVSTLVPVALAETYTAETAHYVVTSDRSEALARKVARRMEIMLENGYQKLFPYKIPRGKKFRIRMFRKRETFAEYMKQKRGHVPQGYIYLHSERPWHPENEIVAYEWPEVPMFADLYHEGWHHHVRGKINKPPQWLNEGFGEYFEACLLGPSGKVFYRVNRPQLRRLQEGILKVQPSTEKGKYEYTNRPLVELFGLSTSEWETDKKANYSLSWGACYVLRHHPNPEYRRLLREALAALKPRAKGSKNTDSVHRIIFSQVRPERFQADFEAFIRELRAPGDEAFYSGFRNYMSREYEVALEYFERACKADALHYRPWQYKGLVYSKLGRYAEASNCLVKSLELHPDNWPAWKLLAEVSYRCGRYDDAVAAADQAIKLKPSLKPEMDELKESIFKKRGGKSLP